VPESAERSVMGVWQRIGLWFLCLLVAVALFSAVLSLGLTIAGSARVGLVVSIFRITMMCALPVWCFCLPFVIAVKNAEGSRIWIVPLSGSLLGPLLVGLWFLILQMGGTNEKLMWQGDPLIGWVGSGLAGMIFAFIVGLLTSSIYVVSLKVLHRRSVEAWRRSAQI
jgi:hypothetical protein